MLTTTWPVALAPPASAPLTLGDFITPTLVGGAGSDFIGNVVYRSVGIASDVPFAAAFATIPLVVMGVYLLVARRLGAFEAL